ncbi:uncharacterized protein LOC125959322 [Anopheles darlingi]|uniref:uncharacterized protein LOC125959322 n=1 Tax=Anopheles darlingi TaxID=43151 RepID=UPI00210040EB|nr:uncharacterized protein LOC125959322 [Anopheles darlingi]
MIALATSVANSAEKRLPVLKQERGEKNRMEPHTKLCQGHTHHNTMTNFTDVATTASPKIYKTIAIVANPNIYISPSEGTGNDSTHQNCNQLQQHSQPQINYIQPVEENLQEHDSISTNINPTDRVIGEDAGIVSSESEKDSEMDSVSTADHHILRPNILAIEDHESAGLVFQESFDDELPYIPTTLPEERPVGIKLKPIKERSQIDIRTYHPLERPRSTTPIHLASLEAYCDRTAVVAIMDTAMLAGERSLNSTVNVTEKLHISLPSKKTVDTNGGKKIFEHRSSLGSLTMPLYTPSSAVFFNTTKSVTTGIVGGEQYRSGSTTMKSTVVAEDSQTFTTPPPLPPRKTSASNSMPTGQKWIDVEAIPEMRKAPKRITAIPQKQLLQNISTSLHSRPLETAQDEQFYTYLKMKDEIAESEVPSLQPSSS